MWCSGTCCIWEINSCQELAWRKSIEVLDEGRKTPRTLALFPEDHCEGLLILVVELVREPARVQPDRNIAAILNRLGRRTGRGHTWTEGRIRAFRDTHDIAVYQET